MLQALIGPVTGLLDKFIPDADQKAKLAHEIATMSEKHAQELALAQIEVLKEDAKGNWFQSSWRPLDWLDFRTQPRYKLHGSTDLCRFRYNYSTSRYVCDDALDVWYA